MSVTRKELNRVQRHRLREDPRLASWPTDWKTCFLWMVELADDGDELPACKDTISSEIGCARQLVGNTINAAETAGLLRVVDKPYKNDPDPWPAVANRNQSLFLPSRAEWYADPPAKPPSAAPAKPIDDEPTPATPVEPQPAL